MWRTTKPVASKAARRRASGPCDSRRRPDQCGATGRARAPARPWPTATRTAHPRDAGSRPWAVTAARLVWRSGGRTRGRPSRPKSRRRCLLRPPWPSRRRGEGLSTGRTSVGQPGTVSQTTQGGTKADQDIAVVESACDQLLAEPIHGPGPEDHLVSRERSSVAEGHLATSTLPMGSPKTATLGSWPGESRPSAHADGSQPEPLNSGPAAKADARSVTPSPLSEALATACAGQYPAASGVACRAPSRPEPPSRGSTSGRRLPRGAPLLSPYSRPGPIGRPKRQLRLRRASWRPRRPNAWGAKPVITLAEAARGLSHHVLDGVMLEAAGRSDDEVRSADESVRRCCRPRRPRRP